MGGPCRLSRGRLHESLGSLPGETPGDCAQTEGYDPSFCPADHVFVCCVVRCQVHGIGLVVVCSSSFLVAPHLMKNTRFYFAFRAGKAAKKEGGDQKPKKPASAFILFGVEARPKIVAEDAVKAKEKGYVVKVGIVSVTTTCVHFCASFPPFFLYLGLSLCVSLSVPPCSCRISRHAYTSIRERISETAEDCVSVTIHPLIRRSGHMEYSFCAFTVLYDSGVLVFTRPSALLC